MMHNANEPSWPMGDQDFDSLLNFDTLDIDFSSIDYDNQPQASQDTAQQLADLAGSLEVQHLQNNLSGQGSQKHHHNPDPSAHQQPHDAVVVQGDDSARQGNHFVDFDIPTFSQEEHIPFSMAQDTFFHPHIGVPPTPNSVEMHGAAARYLPMAPQARANFEQLYKQRTDEAASFTPLASPAVTPHESQFQVAQFSNPGAYFSPLTSPALEAQNAQNQHQYQGGQYGTSGTSHGATPAGMDVEMLEEPAVPPIENAAKPRATRKNAPRSAHSSRVRQSPIVRPGRRKATLSSIMPPKEVSGLVEGAQKSTIRGPSSSGPSVRRSKEGSEGDSVSPQSLSEMGPPAKPGSVSHSPAITGRTNHSAALSEAGSIDLAPATPASLMRLQQSPGFAGSAEGIPALKDLTLPEAVDVNPLLTSLDTAVLEQDQDTPRVVARKTPKLGSLSTPSADAALSGRPSPMLGALDSPTSPAIAQGGRKKAEPKGARNTKKRNSTNSALVSPALRPKISPSIKPLLPDSSISDETHALLLASKSNYQNILDGTTVPGVSYPTSLSTNLTSKRTSHKLAEQGRRNRINQALHQMQALIPSPFIAAKDSKSPEPGQASSAAQQSNSKAAKVEGAIDYIKQLQKECCAKDRLLSEKDRENEALRKELAALKTGSVASQDGAEVLQHADEKPNDGIIDDT